MKKRWKGLCALWIILALVVNGVPVTATAEEIPEQGAALEETLSGELEEPEEESPEEEESTLEDESEEEGSLEDGSDGEEGSLEDEPDGEEGTLEDGSDGEESTLEDGPDGEEGTLEDGSDGEKGTLEDGSDGEESTLEDESDEDEIVLENDLEEAESPSEEEPDEVESSSGEELETDEETTEAGLEEETPAEEIIGDAELPTEGLMPEMAVLSAVPAALAEESEGAAYLYTGSNEVTEDSSVKGSATEITVQFDMSLSDQFSQDVQEPEDKKLDGWKLWDYGITSGYVGTKSLEKGIDDGISASDYGEFVTETNTDRGLLLAPVWRTVRNNILDGDSLTMSIGDWCKLSSGTWVVNGDSTSYTITGTQTVYAAKDGTYTFRKQE